MTQAIAVAATKNNYSSADPITAGFIARELFDWEDKLAQAICERADAAEATGISESDYARALPAESWDEKHLDIPHDWMSGGLFLLAEAIAVAIDGAPLVWEDDVFVYIHCADNEKSIWKPIVEKMTTAEWNDLCGNNEVPSWVASEVLVVMAGLGLLESQPTA